MENRYLKKLHSEILMIMDFVDDVCKKNEIKYYLVGGSLLGAVRHNGFIPWDDDLDIAMPRSDAERFIDVMNTQYTNCDYRVGSKYTDESYQFGFIKVFKKNTVFKEYENSEWPIFLDIFVLDETDGYSEELESEYKYYNRLEGMRNRRNNSRGISLKTYISKVMAPKSYKEVLEKSIAIDNGKGKKYYTNFFSQYGLKRQTMLKQWYGSGVQIEFEGKKYTAPTMFKEFLMQLYGPNYMVIPPVEKRRTHYPLYVKFSDGEEMHFNKPDKRITIEDTLR